MNIIRINNDTLKNINQQLSEKYPYLNTQKNHYEGIFKSWINSDERLPISSSLNYLTKVIFHCNKNDIIDINIVLDKGLPKITKTPKNVAIINNMKTLLEHDLNDFPLIKNAVDFYGKSIDEFGDDIMPLCSFNSSVYFKIKNENLKKQCAHIFKGLIMLILGILFYYLKIATIIEDIYSNNHEKVSTVMAIFTSKKKEFNFDKIKKELISKDFLHKLLDKNGTSDKYYDGFYIDRFRTIYDMYYEPGKFFSNLNHNEYLKYLQQFPDFKIIFAESHVKRLEIIKNKSNIINEYFYLLPIYHQFGKKCDAYENDVEIHNIKPNIFNFDDTQILIEV
ncbi:putative orfan [Tupanvirus soda lake]|uniref:Orfan n=2 Tax=Tupanvirus TaxID=2094720 RepID=A0AC62ACR7_9VIRU|nr:putative orfan [Tupanvirus soda lake]QKU35585.1 putative orfan [Tupanvirus soda lake]